MADKQENRLNRQFDQIERMAPGAAKSFLQWLRKPGVQLIRIPLGVLLVIGGILSFLPVLGIWMLPLGLLILALDVRLLRGPVTAIILRFQHFLRRRRLKREEAARRREQEER